MRLWTILPGVTGTAPCVRPVAEAYRRAGVRGGRSTRPWSGAHQWVSIIHALLPLDGRDHSSMPLPTPPPRAGSPSPVEPKACSAEMGRGHFLSGRGGGGCRGEGGEGRYGKGVCRALPDRGAYPYRTGLGQLGSADSRRSKENQLIGEYFLAPGLRELSSTQKTLCMWNRGAAGRCAVDPCTPVPV